MTVVASEVSVPAHSVNVAKIAAMNPNDQAAFYSFIIHNKSSAPQSYTLFNQTPTVKPQVDGLFSHAVLLGRGVAPRSGSSTLMIERDNPHAICGTIYGDQAVRIQTVDRRPVKLGYKRSQDFYPGTTCLLNMTLENFAFAPSEGPAGDKGEEGAFCIRTGNFLHTAAQNNNQVVALGLSTSPSSRVGVYASFVPMPNRTYQITPSKLFYIVPREVGVNSTKPEDIDLGQALHVDFGTLTSPVHIEHGDDNTLQIVEDGGEAVYKPRL